MYTTILVPLDGSPTAEAVLPLVRGLALSLAVPVELLEVIETAAAVTVEARDAWSRSEFADDVRRAREAYLRRVSQSFPKEAVTVDVASGSPAEVILEKAGADPSKLVAIATHGRSGIKRWLLGSVAEKLLVSTRNPLLVIRAAGESAMREILKAVVVPLDGSRLAEKSLPHAAHLARQLHLDVHLLRVYTLPPNGYLVGDGLLVQGAAQLRERLQGEVQAYLENKLQELRAAGLERVSIVALEGDPASEIIDFATATADALVAMSTHGRSGIGRWVLGSVTEKVIRYGKTPVLVIRPE